MLGCTDDPYEPIDWAAPGGVGAIIWSPRLSDDPSKLTTPPTSWADLWDTRTFPRKRCLRRGPKRA